MLCVTAQISDIGFAIICVVVFALLAGHFWFWFSVHSQLSWMSINIHACAQVQEVDEHWEFDSLLQRVAIEMQEESEKILRAMNDENVIKDDDFWILEDE